MDIPFLIESVVCRELQTQAQPLLMSIAGAQGAGKSTMARVLAQNLTAAGINTALFSLDDLYLTRAARRDLATRVHPALAVRGVPGTHDLDEGNRLLDALCAAEPGTKTRLPAFDKSRDDRRPTGEAPLFTGRPHLVLCEGWCMGATPQEPHQLTAPINALENEIDADATYRTWINRQLAGPYRAFFARFTLQLFLAAPSFTVVGRWRGQQEAALAASQPSGDQVMNATQLARFIQYFERITRHMLLEQPHHSHMTLYMNKDRTPRKLVLRKIRS